MELTQVKAAAILGITQASFSQYLNCVIALNTDMVLKIAAMLKVAPGEIDPEIDQTLRVAHLAHRSLTVPVVLTSHIKDTFGGLSKLNTVVTDPGPFTGMYAVLVTRTTGHIDAGSYLVINPDQRYSTGSLLFVMLRNQHRLIAKLLGRTADALRVKDLTGAEHILPHNRVFYAHKVHSIVHE